MVWDVVVIGGGAAGLFCAGLVGQQGKRVLVLDHAKKLGEKIRISGGGRCNFTNTQSTPEHFLSSNPKFAKSALARYRPQHFIDLMKRYRVGFHEKHRGQLFCDDSSQAIIDLLLNECRLGAVSIQHPVSVHQVVPTGSQWEIHTTQGPVRSQRVVIATGGLPVPAIGATGFALDLARHLHLNVIAPRPALVPLAFTSHGFDDLASLAGVSLPVMIRAGRVKHRYGEGQFSEDLLITHKGLSGPAVLQVSSYWEEGEPIQIQWVDRVRLQEWFDSPDQRTKTVEGLLTGLLPARLAKSFAESSALMGRRWAEVGKKDRLILVDLLTKWSVKPAGTLGWKKAEVMLGGVDTDALDSRSLMAKEHPGLYFIGECVDVTGHLGGHNFQWAWASAHACATSMG